jgi:Mg/Co/Ni transporter MgtE
MTEPEPLSVHMHAGDAVEILRGRVVPVTNEGTLVGVVRAAALAAAPPETVLGDLMEDPPLIDVYEDVEGLVALAEFFEGDPMPLVDENGTLRGMLDLTSGPAR